MSKTVRVRTTGSEWWAVVGRPRPTTVLVQKARAGGQPDLRFPAFEACGICFAGDPTAADERQRRPGFCVAPVVMGRCSWCGYAHDAETARYADDVTSDAKAAAAAKAKADDDACALP